MDGVNPNLNCILVILPSSISPIGILIQRNDIILEWILSHKPSKKIKTYVEKVSELIIKGKLRLCQLAGIDPAEIIVPFTTDEIKKLWEDNKPWQRACADFGGELNSNYPKSNRLNHINRTSWILPLIVCDATITADCTFYTDAIKSGKASYKSEELSKVEQSPYNSVKKAEVYVILMVLRYFKEILKIVTDSQYT